MIGAFTFNNIHTSGFKLVCRSVKRPLLSSARTKRVDLVGVSGAFDFPDPEYNLRNITMRIMYIGQNYEELRTRARDIAVWLAQDNWSKLILDDEPDKYYLAKVTSELDLQSFYESGAVDVIFDCQPFAYSLTEESLTITNETQQITVVGTRKINSRSPVGSKFLLTADITDSLLSITVNDQTLRYRDGPVGTLVIDSVQMTASVANQNVFPFLSGDIDKFFTLYPGINNIFYSGYAENGILLDYIPMYY